MLLKVKELGTNDELMSVNKWTQDDIQLLPDPSLVLRMEG